MLTRQVASDFVGDFVGVSSRPPAAVFKSIFDDSDDEEEDESHSSSSHPASSQAASQPATLPPPHTLLAGGGTARAGADVDVSSLEGMLSFFATKSAHEVAPVGGGKGQTGHGGLGKWEATEAVRCRKSRWDVQVSTVCSHMRLSQTSLARRGLVSSIEV